MTVPATDPDVWHALHRLTDYPVLAAFGWRAPLQPSWTAELVGILSRVTPDRLASRVGGRTGIDAFAGDRGDSVILFLDFDGVLPPRRGLSGARTAGAARRRQIFMWAGYLVDALASAQHVRIVLSTSWARELRYARARDYLPAELRQRVIGATWHSGMAI